MLTFEFTGVIGSMTEQERLTSGMVGKQVQLRLSADWDGLSCTAVFIAGDICRALEMTGTTLTIPEDVLRYPFRKLVVGVCGTNADGSLVIPTILAEGPFVEIGANPYADPVAVELPVWKNLQNQIGNLNLLHTEAKDSLVDAINELAGQSGSASESSQGRDGFSIYHVNDTIDTGLLSMMNVKPSAIDTNGRTVQAGDFLLTDNGCIAAVTSASASGVTAEFLMKLLPVRGTDYWTEDDIAAIKAYVDEAVQAALQK